MYMNSSRFFAAPFLLGALTGGAAVGIFNPYRPRPIYPVYSQPYYNYSGYTPYY